MSEHELVVCDLCNLRKLLIRTKNAPDFRLGDRVQIKCGKTVKVSNAISQVEAEQICRVETW